MLRIKYQCNHFIHLLWVLDVAEIDVKIDYLNVEVEKYQNETFSKKPKAKTVINTLSQLSRLKIKSCSEHSYCLSK